jgi:hypothetical protein
MSCIHEQIDVSNEWHDDMHCEGWNCRTCDSYIHGECHPQSWCRDDFCGANRTSLEPEREPIGGTRHR